MKCVQGCSHKVQSFGFLMGEQFQGFLIGDQVCLGHLFRLDADLLARKFCQKIKDRLLCIRLIGQEVCFLCPESIHQGNGQTYFLPDLPEGGFFLALTGLHVALGETAVAAQMTDDQVEYGVVLTGKQDTTAGFLVFHIVFYP